MDFIPPYLMAFFVAEFVLVMQLMWKHIDDIAGKGISLAIILELIFYFAVSIIYKAVPVTILIASVMVFGNLAERYELASMKSAGVSLTRIFAGGIIISILTACFSLFASNYLKPRATFKFMERMTAVKSQKLALNFQEGVFSKDFRNFVIRIGDIAENGKDISDVLIYDHTSSDKSKVNMLVAGEGTMYASDDDGYFIMALEEGEQYREMKEKSPTKAERKFPLVRTSFNKWTKVFDMSQFEMQAKSLSTSRREHDLLSGKQLRFAIDSFDTQMLKSKNKTNNNFNNLLSINEVKPEIKKKDKSTLPKSIRAAISKKDQQIKERKSKKTEKKGVITPVQNLSKPLNEYNALWETLDSKSRKSGFKAARTASKNKNDLIDKSSKLINNLKYQQSRYVMRHHQMYSYALICIIFLFIGAPLGSIVRKGGYGYPLLIAIIFYMLFIVLEIMGDKLNTSKALGGVMAAWLPVFVITPMAVVVTLKALNDSDFSFVKNFFSKFSSDSKS